MIVILILLKNYQLPRNPFPCSTADIMIYMRLIIRKRLLHFITKIIS